MKSMKYLVLAATLACGGSSTETPKTEPHEEPAPAPEPAEPEVDADVAKALGVANAIAKDASSADAALAEAGLTEASYRELLYEIAGDAEKSAAFAAGRH